MTDSLSIACGGKLVTSSLPLLQSLLSHVASSRSLPPLSVAVVVDAIAGRCCCCWWWCCSVSCRICCSPSLTVSEAFAVSSVCNELRSRVISRSSSSGDCRSTAPTITAPPGAYGLSNSPPPTLTTAAAWTGVGHWIPSPVRTDVELASPGW